MEGIRIHDGMYLNEDRKMTPKEYFKFIASHIAPEVSRLERPKILDVGCATGDLVWYLSTLYPHAEIHGIDVMPALIERAKKEVPTAIFQIADIYSGDDLPEEKFDALFFCGVHSIFDEFKPWIDNLLKLTHDQGHIYVFGMFNPSDVDVLVRTRYAVESKEQSWQTGWNLFSIKSIGQYLDSLDLKYSFKPFELPIDILPNEEDPLRSWTFKNDLGSRLIVNGTQILHHMYLLEISR